MSDSSCFAAGAEILTGSERGAVAVIRLVCCTMSPQHPANALFRSVGGRSLCECKIGRITYGDWRGEDVVLVRISGAEWEVSCHGGFAPVKRILSDLEAAGIPQNRIDLSMGRSALTPQQEWSGMLANARTISTADLILGQPKALSSFAGEIAASSNAAEARGRVERFLGWNPLVDHLVTPWIIAIAGPPNAGKSSLLNAVVGYQRSIVFDQPGTTRDVVQCDVVVADWPMRFVDTAGIRDDSGNPIEQQGISAARQLVQDADLTLVVVDQTQGVQLADQQLIEFAQQSGSVALLRNKNDLSDATGPQQIPDRNAVPSFPVSAKTASGIEPVLTWIADTLMPAKPSHSEPLPVISSMKIACEEFLRDGHLHSLILRLNDLTTAILPRTAHAGLEHPDT